MTSKEYRDLMHYSKSDLIGMLETFARSIEGEECVSTIYRLAFQQAKERTEKAEAERDMYKHMLETVCVLLDDADSMVDYARAIAFSPFAARGETMEDLRERLNS